HLSQPKHLTGQFNASLGSSICVFLDEALFAGDRQHEGVLKALVTESTLQLEAKFLDPITVPNRLRLIIASTSEWVVPVGIGDRRFGVFDVADSRGSDYGYFDALNTQMENGGLEAMMCELLNFDVIGFEIRNIPGTAARTDQMTRSLRGADKWLYTVLQDGALGLDSGTWGAGEM